MDFIIKVMVAVISLILNYSYRINGFGVNRTQLFLVGRLVSSVMRFGFVRSFVLTIIY